MTNTWIELPPDGGAGSGVSSLNGLIGSINLLAGAGITITPSGNNLTIASSLAGGTVTSVSLADGSSSPIYTISGSPVTTSGTLTFSLSNQTANKVFAGPTSGGAAQPTFRSLVIADLPVGTGTVTSVGLVDSTGLFNITGSPVTSSGNLTLSSFQSQGQRFFFAAPNGGNGAPTFRAILASDVPTLNQNTTGTASNVTGVVAIANGGTNSSAALNNNRIIQSSGGAIVEALPITANRALISDTNGIPTQSVTTSAELAFVSGVTSSIQTQLNGKQATGNYITALTGDVVATGPGSVTATIQANAVTTSKINNNAVDNTKLAQMPAFTFKANNTAGTANAQDITIAAANSMLGAAGVPVSTVHTTTFTISNTNQSEVFLTDTSGGAFTVNLPPASTTPNGIEYTFKDTTGSWGANPLTIAPNGADLLEGLNSSRPLVTNYGSVTYTTDGISNWWGVWSRSRVSTEVFTASTTWVAPAGVTRIILIARPGAGGGGGGGGSGAGFGGATAGGGGGGRGGGGGGAASLIQAYYNVVPGTTYTITIGAGGTGGTAGTVGAGGNGGNGGVTVFDTLTFGKNSPATGATGGTGGAAGVVGTIAAGGAAGVAGGAVGTVYNPDTDLPTAAVSGAAGGAPGANGTSAGNSAATVPILYGTSNVGANGGAGGALSGATQGGGGGGGAGGSSGFPEAYSVYGRPVPSGGVGGAGGAGGLGNQAGAGGNGGASTAGTNGTEGLGGGGGGAGGGGGGGSTTGGARGTSSAGGNGSNGILIIQRVG